MEKYQRRVLIPLSHADARQLPLGRGATIKARYFNKLLFHHSKHATITLEDARSLGPRRGVLKITLCLIPRPSTLEDARPLCPWRGSLGPRRGVLKITLCLIPRPSTLEDARPLCPWRGILKITLCLIPRPSTLEDASKTRSARNAVRECTQTYMTERNRKHDAVLRRIFEGKRR